jgi:hypothetical protein
MNKEDLISKYEEAENLSKDELLRKYKILLIDLIQNTDSENNIEDFDIDKLGESKLGDRMQRGFSIIP